MANPVKKLRNLLGDLMSLMMESHAVGIFAEAKVRVKGEVEYGLEDEVSISAEHPAVPGVKPGYSIGREKDHTMTFDAEITLRTGK